MSRLIHYADVQDSALTNLSSKDKRNYQRTLEIAREHDSGGSFHMAATWSRAKPSSAVGMNRLDYDPSVKVADLDIHYPNVSGCHAELDLWVRMGNDNMKGGTVYVAGVSGGRNELSSTLPCVPCAALMTAAGVKWVVANLADEIVKVRTANLVTI